MGFGIGRATSGRRHRGQSAVPDADQLRRISRASSAPYDGRFNAPPDWRVLVDVQHGAKMAPLGLNPSSGSLADVAPLDLQVKTFKIHSMIVFTR